MTITTEFELARAPECEVGDIVRCDPRNTRTTNRTYLHDDGKYYCELRRTEPDMDDEVAVKMIHPDPNNDETYGTYIDAYELEKVPDRYRPWERTQPDDEIEEYIASRDDEESLAVLEEEQKNLVQMQEIRARTIEPGILQLPVGTVTSAENSEQWAIEVEHPVNGTMRFYREKPLGGWSDDYDIVRLLESYGIEDGNPYKLQRKEVYVELTGDDPSSERSWELRHRDEVISPERPESMRPATERATERLRERVTVPKVSFALVYGMIGATLLVAGFPMTEFVLSMAWIFVFFALVYSAMFGELGEWVEEQAA